MLPFVRFIFDKSFGFGDRNSFENYGQHFLVKEPVPDRQCVR